MAPIQQITDQTFDAEVLADSGAVLVEFSAPWCGPCLGVEVELQALADERECVRVVSLNIDNSQQSVERFGVQSLPTMILFRAGVETQRVVGAFEKSELLHRFELMDREPAL